MEFDVMAAGSHHVLWGCRDLQEQENDLRENFHNAQFFQLEKT